MRLDETRSTRQAVPSPRLPCSKPTDFKSSIKFRRRHLLNRSVASNAPIPSSTLPRQICHIVSFCPPLQLSRKMPPVRTAKKNSSSVRAQPSGRKTRGPAATNPSVPTPPSPAEARSDAPELLVHANAPLPELGSSTYLIGPGDDGFYGSVPAPPPKVKVEKAIHFRSNAEWEDGWRSKIGRPTKKLKFGSGFVLTE